MPFWQEDGKTMYICRCNRWFPSTIISSGQYEQTALTEMCPQIRHSTPPIRESFCFKNSATPKRCEPERPLYLDEFVQLLCSTRQERWVQMDHWCGFGNTSLNGLSLLPCFFSSSDLHSISLNHFLNNLPHWRLCCRLCFLQDLS